MKKYVKALINLAVALVIFLLVILLLPKLLIFFAPFVAGWIIALIASPLVRFFEEKIKIKRKAGSAFVIIVVIGLVVLVLYLAGTKLGQEIVGLVRALPDMWAGMETDFEEIGQNLSVVYNRLPKDLQLKLTEMAEQVGSYVGDILGQLSSPTIAAVGNFAMQLPTVLIGVIMALLSAYFFVAERDVVGQWFRGHMPSFVQSNYRIVKHSLVKSVGGYLKAQLKIEVWMYLLLVIGLTLLHVNYALLIALGIAFLDMLPFFGTGTVMVPWAIVKILSGDYKIAVGLLIIWGVGQLARQVIQPKIMGDSMGMPAIPTLFLLYIGYRLSGVIGMIVAVPIGLVVVNMYQEGAFETTKNSILILFSGINHFRRLDEADLEVVREMQDQEKRKSREIVELEESERADRERSRLEEKERRKERKK
ncbi:MAG: sporulation integral membrane protein YtvI [Candidatus Gastranaerophilales bacterium]|nr:sporulation integral membrane protein YtvI [Candidatus Gastranaerophilales bacterium]